MKKLDKRGFICWELIIIIWILLMSIVAIDTVTMILNNLENMELKLEREEYIKTALEEQRVYTKEGLYVGELEIKNLQPVDKEIIKLVKSADKYEGEFLENEKTCEVYYIEIEKGEINK